MTHRGEALATCQQIRTDLPRFLSRIREFEWEPSAQTYDGGSRSSERGAMWPLEQQRLQLAHDPARTALLAFGGYVRLAHHKTVELGWPTIPCRQPTATHHIAALTACLTSSLPIPQRPLGEIIRLVDLARLVQLHWLTTSHPMPPEQRTCRHCQRTDMGANPRGGLCSPCYEFRQDHKRLPSGEELRRYGDTGRWRIRAHHA